MKHQYRAGVHKIVEWADIVNAHPVPGHGVVEGLKEAASGKQRGCLLIAEMSSKGNLATGQYTAGEFHKGFEYCEYLSLWGPRFSAIVVCFVGKQSS